MAGTTSPDPKETVASAGSFGRDLPIRAASGIALMALALGVAWAGGFTFLFMWLVAGALVAWEWQRLAGGEREWVLTGIALLTLLAASPSALHGAALNAVLIVLAGTAVAFAVAETGRKTWSAFGIPYAAAVVVGPVLLRASPAFGFTAVIWLFAVVWGTDVAAYFGGRLVRGPKLWPSVSPGKTWSGALVGAAAAAICGLIVALFLAPSGVRVFPMLTVGLLVSAASQIGDLFESAVKRRAGVKDSSHLIPGHGGLMDRLDGFIFASVLTCLVAAGRSQGTWMAPGLFSW